MTTAVVIYALVVAVPLAAGAALLEQLAALSRRPRRWIWAAALGASIVLGAAVPARALLFGEAAHASASAVSGGAPLAFVARAALPGAWTRLRLGLGANVDALVAAARPFDAVWLGAWVAGSVALVAAYLLGLAVLRRRRRTWREARVQDAAVLVAPDAGPAVIGVWSSRVVLPEWALALDRRSIDLMLRHEHAHTSARDPLLVHAANLALLVMPWNPLAWWMVSRLRIAVELDCDGRVIGAYRHDETCISAYGELLLTVAAHRSAGHPLVVPALLERPSALSRRLSAMSITSFAFSRIRATLAGAGAIGFLLVTGLLPMPRVMAQSTAATPAAAIAQASGDQDSFGKGAYTKDATPQLVLPRPKDHPSPAYTPEAMHARISGTVVLDAIVSRDGTVSDVRMAKSGGHLTGDALSLSLVHGLEQSALSTARRWTFEPGTLDGKPVPVLVKLEFKFTLR